MIILGKINTFYSVKFGHDNWHWVSPLGLHITGIFFDPEWSLSLCCCFFFWPHTMWLVGFLFPDQGLNLDGPLAVRIKSWPLDSQGISPDDLFIVIENEESLKSAHKHSSSFRIPHPSSAARPLSKRGQTWVTSVLKIWEPRQVLFFLLSFFSTYNECAQFRKALGLSP